MAIEVMNDLAIRNMRVLHEQGFVQAFISPAKQDRWSQLLTSHRRQKILKRLAGWEDFVDRKMRQIPASDSPSEIISRMLRLGVNERTRCWLISQCPEIDQSEMPLDMAVSKAFAIGLGTVVSCVPSKLAFYESEVGGRYILVDTTRVTRTP